MDGHRYRRAVMIGRFQPFHLGHRAALERGMALADRVAVVIGSAGRPRSARDPWTARERAGMIAGSLVPADRDRVDLLHQRDSLYDDDRWAAEVARQVAGLEPAGPVALLGLAGDLRGFDPGWFPGWTFEPVPALAMPAAADLRAAYLAGPDGRGPWTTAVPDPVRAFLQDWAATPDYRALAEEWRYLAEYRARWAGTPFPVVFTTVDAVVTGAGRVLLVRRGGQPGRGLLALPGGFLDPAGDRSLRAGALRELREETGIRVPDPDLARRIVAERAFDHPERSQRGRTITYAVHIDLGPGPLPGIEAGDDASHVQWVPADEALDHPEALFEDHGDILLHFLRSAAHQP